MAEELTLCRPPGFDTIRFIGVYMLGLSVIFTPISFAGN